MKKLIIVISVVFLANSLALAGDLQTVFSPNEQNVIFLNCFNQDKEVINHYNKLREKISKNWTSVKDPDLNIIFSNGKPYMKDVTKIFVGGLKKPDGGIVPLPRTTFIYKQNEKGLSQFVMNINEYEKTVKELQKIVE